MKCLRHLSLMNKSSEDIRKELETVEAKINADPNHPSTVYLSEDRSRLLKELQEAQMREWNL